VFDARVLGLLASDLYRREIEAPAVAGASFAPLACAPPFPPLRDASLASLSCVPRDKLDASIIERIRDL